MDECSLFLSSSAVFGEQVCSLRALANVALQHGFVLSPLITVFLQRAQRSPSLPKQAPHHILQQL